MMGQPVFSHLMLNLIYTEQPLCRRAAIQHSELCNQQGMLGQHLLS